MENASKALIIAGAILLAILLITLGIMIFNQAQDTITSSGMSQAEVAAFNSKFNKYEGDQRGSVVKALINEVRASNSSDEAEGNGRGIALSLTGSGVTAKEDIKAANGAVDVKVETGDIQSSGKYNVKVGKTDGAGYVQKITITKK